MASVMTSIRGQNIHYQVVNPEAKTTIVFLHGFTGSTKTWESTEQWISKKYRMISIDLMGHGLTDSPYSVEAYSMDEQVELLREFFEARRIYTCTLVGYSMGGRVALAFAIRYPDKVKKLVLESASPGLKTEEERRTRIKNDRQLAERIEKDGVEAFVNYWETIPLFESQKHLPADIKQQVRDERLNQSPVGLANSLRGMGTGKQSSYWHELKHFQKPVVMLTGELDRKFIQKAIEMKEEFPICEHHIVPAVGHAIHVENPQIFATIIKEHLEDE
ncbi:2-succinyl-6-hydroxy-2,4-cyclohexadiene-1-carboxylate synthase [Rummeliibacillus sp. G93]|uniref:2-succinyl-6-hydroxy-2, 4-cyclohexadiene-1-carboxylate synthase n=1 Tax=Rummeliibacillus TaxID=648802 RepID=UPI00116A7EE6|nr:MULTISPECIES: 2-succinyl-6-hydroxy-2,4-cyclohexadiene-1-carboxylate synthase [Rummeliibacillus]MBB5168641.1 2-succinyl-6-hydroxy-2,4-cyclohexadiene-1-carboxylate synthase [Rummeliibacillus stabekisii]UQW96576.1 2-succinyl-6-hydroxy-2,4-cyclohexadiene-1-carboxylate synthase [Rummeliibacillus sp. G93]GEL05221.1 putative 2-succinyl-6-hydroxy-2,4-cyclohexadiene-1-carboxylate synthase [Rummeliibacillus stabekisii]